MVVITRKCRYALRAVLELAKRRGGGPVPVRDIARKQVIPRRFLEDILKMLKDANLVRAHRGARGGYELLPSPEQLTVGQIVKLVDGPLRYAECMACGGDQYCPLQENCPFSKLWQDAETASAGVLDAMTFQRLVEDHRGLFAKQLA